MSELTPSEFDPSTPISLASTIPSRWYTDGDFYQKEKEKCFLSSWQLVGRTELLKNPGDFFTGDIAGEPIVVLRDKENQVQAFANVCRHRAAKVCRKSHGNSSFLQCQYHGWTYNLDGELRGTPEFQGAENFEKSDYRLPRYQVKVWGPFVFVNTGGEAPWEDTYGPIREMENTLQLDKYAFHSRRTYDLNCNWKVFVDNYLDGGYHIRTIHPNLSGVIQNSQYQTQMHQKCSVQVSPLQKDPQNDNVTAVRSGDVAYYWWFYPNLMLNWYEDVVDTNLVLPLGVDKCRVIIDFYFRNTDPDFQERSINVAQQIQEEDVEICEEAFQGLLSRTFDVGRFSPQREAPGLQFHQLLSRDIQPQR